MIVYDKEQKEIVIPNGIGNINLFNNGVEAGYNQGYGQGQADMVANARVLNVTENGVYQAEPSGPIIPDTYTVTGVYANGTEFYSYAKLNGKIFNTKIAGSINSRLEFWYKGDNTLAGYVNNVIIGSGDTDKDNSFQVKYFDNNNNGIIRVRVGINFGDIREWDNTVWHHLIISKTEGGVWIDGNHKFYFVYDGTIDGEFFINGIGYDVNSDGGGIRNANGYFGMIKIDDTIIIPTANGFKNTNTGELLEVVKDGDYTFTENLPTYGELELYKTINVNVPDLNGSYDEGYEQGKTDGINEQKSKLESINITENGTYTKEDGYNEVVVNVADLNGSYDEGYNQGQADVAANARVLNVTENGVYTSKYTEEGEIVMPFDLWGDDFYSYAFVKNKIYNTGIIPNENTRLEFWFKPDEGDYMQEGSVVIMNNTNSLYGNFFGIFHSTAGDQSYYANVGGDRVNFRLTNGVLYHIVLSVADGLVINGEQIGTFSSSSNFSQPLYINGMSNDLNASADGEFGMIKIDDAIIIPTENGFLNQNTNELLEVVYDSGVYKFTEISKPTIEGNLYRTINVNVIPKINVQKEGVKLQGSTFTEVPEWVDLDGITSMDSMFVSCNNLTELPILNVPYCMNFSRAFSNIPFKDLTNIQYWVYPKNAKWECTFEQNRNIEKCPAIYMEGDNGYYQGYPFWVYSDLNNFTEFGGFIGLKYSITQDYTLPKLSNLTYESCINVLNGLYDFTGNGETPNSEQGKLKVAQSFIDKVGDEISIGVAKGWSISA